MDELNSLPMLDKVLREALRLYAPVSATMRQAAEDTIIPLGKPIVDKNGVSRSELQCVL
jgi:cytochrome P450